MSFQLQILGAFISGSILAALVCWLIARRWLAFHNSKTQELVRAAEREARLASQENQSKEFQVFQKERVVAEQASDKRKHELDLKELEIREHQKRLESKQQFLEEKMINVERMDAEAKRKKYNLENLRQLCRKRLLHITHMSEGEAKKLLKEELRDECEEELRILRNSILQRSDDELRSEAQRIIIDCMQRLSGMPSTDITAATVKLPSDDMKGRLIGREGRNIKAFETVTGTTLLIDETPETVMVSSFDPVKRDVARIALENLIKDGRIHPASIEEAVTRADIEMQDNVLHLGQKAIDRLNLTNVQQEVVSLLGKLNYRLSNNQNTLEHSVEVAFLMSMMASEIGLDPKIAKRCGLFHDIGKAMPQDLEGSHAIAAAKLLKKYGEDQTVINAVAAHHEEVPPESVYAPLLMLADAISAKRPGARSECISGYVQRIRGLEDVARSFEGISDVYAVQAGREVRVIVSPNKYDDLEAKRLAWRIKQKIEKDVDYPGNVKVTVIREQRFTETAKQSDI
ncbi:MAG: ribonuclease Y [Verrucomicrobia bacterium CG_4_10_14_3_um_filter_43_23]|nr:MAG: ribonuclease Y [Verrucomicrobia bacterium CG22_combo_CG10-13_8_21_14_all_43_17]PIX58070.1 MAG: ribonuclease Y [Verrucomicrobia bacterium CG_4_10_14_3_um_filter_43_23]PIY61165.1 MAG: ribonuclease Y [Verrucomicrobia bacterium CG_4_10_14_0_8_um_filter_43_34]PJA43338.1 MAG: ribonuclease Y [Verrucomicrobia bacterium CG_4_9_14_3_um_filter_43_20]